jgi:hypothetical protein
MCTVGTIRTNDAFQKSTLRIISVHPKIFLHLRERSLSRIQTRNDH